MHELRIASIGNVDSAKSTTISCIANNIIDNGRGSARSKILKHKHEGDTGRTSSITQYYINNNDNSKFIIYKRYIFTNLVVVGYFFNNNCMNNLFR